MRLEWTEGRNPMFWYSYDGELVADERYEARRTAAVALGALPCWVTETIKPHSDPPIPANTFCNRCYSVCPPGQNPVCPYLQETGAVVKGEQV